MLALSLWQPWAELIVSGAKTIETRSWAAPPNVIGQRIAIHASVATSVLGELDHEQLCTLYRGVVYGPTWETIEGRPVVYKAAMAGLRQLPRGVIVATAVLSRCAEIIEPCDCEPPHVLVGTRHKHRNNQPMIRHTEINQTPVRADPFGDFTPGRFLWFFSRVERLRTPVPATGRQKLWEWEPETAAA